MEAVFETNRTPETEMGESCQKKLILQAQNKITILCFVIDLLEMHLEVLGSFHVRQWVRWQVGWW